VTVGWRSGETESRYQFHGAPVYSIQTFMAAHNEVSLEEEIVP